MVFLVVFLGVAGSVRAEDQVFIWDDAANKEAELHGTIDNESPAGLRIKTRMGIKEIPPMGIRGVIYQSKKATPPEFRSPRGKELQAQLPGTKPAKRAELLDKALTEYKELDAQAREEAAVHRYLQFKIAELTALLAREDASKVDAAVAALTAYKSDFASGWEVVPSLRLLAQLLEEKADFAGASQAYADLSGLPGLPRNLKLESDMAGVRVLLRGGKFPEAEARLKDLEKDLPPDDPQRTFVDVCVVQAQMAQGKLDTAEGKLQAVLKATTDSAIRSIAHNLLGDYYRLKGQLDEAFWNYLRVDVLYNQDRDEHAKALLQLSKLFDKVKNDPVRAQECLTRLKGPDFSGTSYQRQANEAKK
jgi:hypothetical protein